jgi:hypothetical protein
MMMTRAQVAALLHVPERFVRLLVERHVLEAPGEDGFSVASVQRSRAQRPWLNDLATPMSDGELARIDSRLHVPDGMGADMAGRRYAPLWQVLDRLWP